jgi:hypothetical protein
MLLAARFPELGKRGPKGKGTGVSLETKEISSARVSQARAVYRYCPEMVEQIIEGKMGLDEAYAEALRFCAATRRA